MNMHLSYTRLNFCNDYIYGRNQQLAYPTLHTLECGCHIVYVPKTNKISYDNNNNNNNNKNKISETNTPLYISCVWK